MTTNVTWTSVTRTEALGLAHRRLLGLDHGPVRQRLALDMVSQSFHTRHHHDLLTGVLWLTVELFLDGDPHAERRLSELRALLAEDANRSVNAAVGGIEVMLAIRSGALDQAERQAAAAARQAGPDGDAEASGWHLPQLITIRWFQGRVAELLPTLNDETGGGADGFRQAALALAAATAGDHGTATAALAALNARGLADLPRPGTWLATMHAVVEAAHLLADTGTAQRAYELLSPFADRPIMVGPAVACLGSVHHALGVAALTLGRLDRAVEHLGTAIHRNLALAHWPAVVSSRVRLAEALNRRGRPEDTAAARRELADAATETAALGTGTADSGPPDVSEPAVTCSLDGRSWRIALGRRTAVVGHSVGMFHLAVLTANPHRDIPAVDLVAGLVALSDAAGASPRQARTGAAARNDLGGAARPPSGGDSPLDGLADTAAAGVRCRLPIDEERARVAVGKAIRRAIQRVTEADAVIGEHLHGATHTGVRCSYLPG